MNTDLRVESDTYRDAMTAKLGFTFVERVEKSGDEAVWKVDEDNRYFIESARNYVLRTYIYPQQIPPHYLVEWFLEDTSYHDILYILLKAGLLDDEFQVNHFESMLRGLVRIGEADKRLLAIFEK